MQSARARTPKRLRNAPPWSFAYAKVWIPWQGYLKLLRSTKAPSTTWKPDQARAIRTNWMSLWKWTWAVRVCFRSSRICANRPLWKMWLFWVKIIFLWRHHGSRDTRAIWTIAIIWWRNTSRIWTWTILDSLISNTGSVVNLSLRLLLLINSEWSWKTFHFLNHFLKSKFKRYSQRYQHLNNKFK